MQNLFRVCDVRQIISFSGRFEKFLKKIHEKGCVLAGEIELKQWTEQSHIPFRCFDKYCKNDAIISLRKGNPSNRF